MKKAKIILSMILIVVFVFMSNITSFAYAEQYAHAAPDGIAGQWIEDDLKVDMSVSSSPAYPNMVFFRYKPSTFRPLPTSFVSNNNRKIYIYLMEDDIGNNDDYVDQLLVKGYDTYLDEFFEGFFSLESREGILADDLKMFIHALVYPIAAIGHIA